MKSKSLNETSYSDTMKIGAGIFAYIMIGTFAFLFKVVIRDAFLYFEVNPIIVSWTIEVVRLTIYIIGLHFIIRMLSEN